MSSMEPNTMPHFAYDVPVTCYARCCPTAGTACDQCGPRNMLMHHARLATATDSAADALLAKSASQQSDASGLVMRTKALLMNGE